jgi:hypothetical protein
MTAWILLASALSCAMGAKAHKAEKRAPAPVAKASHSAAPDKGSAQADQACTQDLARGDVASARKRCGALKPSDAPESVYWRMVLSDDPNDLRKGLCAAALKPVHPDPRLLLLAGRYQFSRGETRELQDLVWLAAKLKLKGPQIDTLKRLSEGN